VAGSASVILGSYGMALPHTVWWAGRQAGVGWLVVSILIGAGLFAYLRALPEAERPGSSDARVLASAGLAVVVTSCAVFLPVGGFTFTATGPANRINIGAAVGVAALLVAGLLLVSGRVGRPWLASAGAGLLAGCFMVVTAAIGGYCVTAAAAADQTLEAVRHIEPDPQPGTTLLLYRTCRYAGPAVIFESWWDVQGALRLGLSQPDIQGDVLTSESVLTDDGVRTEVYGEALVHPFGENLDPRGRPGGAGGATARPPGGAAPFRPGARRRPMPARPRGARRPAVAGGPLVRRTRDGRVPALEVVSQDLQPRGRAMTTSASERRRSQSTTVTKYSAGASSQASQRGIAPSVDRRSTAVPGGTSGR
jgi:hypothetical protein